MEFLKPDDIAKRLGVHPRTVKRWLNDGKLKGVLLGDRAGWRIAPEDYEAFIEERQTETREFLEGKAAA